MKKNKPLPHLVAMRQNGEATIFGFPTKADALRFIKDTKIKYPKAQFAFTNADEVKQKEDKALMNFKIDIKTRKQFKEICKIKGLKMNSVLERILKEWVDKNLEMGVVADD